MGRPEKCHSISPASLSFLHHSIVINLKFSTMKNLRSKIVFVGVALFMASLQTFAQKVLPEITITAANYKYLNAVNTDEASQPVNMLEQYAASYDIKGAEFYEEENDQYMVSFFIPQGKILAAYDKNGKLMRTAERFTDVAVPKAVSKGVTKRFPNWTISKDVYKVSYFDEGGAVTRRVYKLLLENGDKRMRIKATDAGEVL